MVCDICNKLCTQNRNTRYNVVTKKFDTLCNPCRNEIKQVNIDYAVLSSTYDDGLNEVPYSVGV